MADGAIQDDPIAEFRALSAEVRALETSLLAARFEFARHHGMSFGGARDEYAIFGYDDQITARQYRDEYKRGGIAGRIVDAFPKATWRGKVELIEDEDPEKKTEFEQAWADLDVKHNIQAKLLRADKLAGLSTYAVLLIGAPGELHDPLPKGKPADLLYVTPFSGGGGPGGSAASRSMTSSFDSDASIFEFDVDPASPRFGLPHSYTLRRVDAANAFPRPVHWTRIIHIAEDLLDDEVYGQPTLERVWNLLADLRKVTGGGAEAFWLRANQGLHIDIDKDMTLPDAANVIANLKEQRDAYKHQLDRWLRTKGAKVNVLGSDVANFESPADAILTQIAGAKAIPKRILTGSEMGELASSQDRENWRDQVNGRQTGYAEPFILRPFVDRLIEYGYMPSPKKGPRDYTVRWSQITTLTEQEKTQGASAWAGVNNAYGDVVFTDSEIREKWGDKPPLTDEQREEIKKQKEAAQPPPPPAPPAEPAKGGGPEEDPDIDVGDEDDKDAKGEKARAFPRAAEEHQFASTQLQLPPDIAERLLTFAASIPDKDLAEDGREDDPHVTVKYGLHDPDPESVRRALRGVKPIPIMFGKTSVFGADDHDVLYVVVESPYLVALNKRLTKALPVTDTHPKYVPHVTIAYLKPSLGQKYAGDDRFEDLTATIDAVRFSTPDGDATDLPLTFPRAAMHYGESWDATLCGVATHDRTTDAALVTCNACRQFLPDNDEELIRVLAAAIEAGATDVVRAIVGLRDADA